MPSLKNCCNAFPTRVRNDFVSWLQHVGVGLHGFFGRRFLRREVGGHIVGHRRTVLDLVGGFGTIGAQLQRGLFHFVLAPPVFSLEPTHWLRHCAVHLLDQHFPFAIDLGLRRAVSRGHLCGAHLGGSVPKPSVSVGRQFRHVQIVGLEFNVVHRVPGKIRVFLFGVGDQHSLVLVGLV